MWKFVRLIGVTLVIAVGGLVVLLAAFARSPLPQDDSAPATTNTIPNVGYDIYKPSVIPHGYAIGLPRTISFGGESQIIQEIDQPSNSYFMANLREAPYRGGAQPYWICNMVTDCSQIGQDNKGHAIFKGYYKNSQTTVWGIRFSNLFINLEAADRAGYTDSDAVAVFNSLAVLKPGSNSPYVQGEFLSTIRYTTSYRPNGTRLNFTAQLSSGGHSYANQAVDFVIDHGSGSFNSPYKTFHLTSDNDGKVALKITLPWAVFGEEYNFSFVPSTPDITETAPGSMNTFNAPPVGISALGILLLAVLGGGTWRILRKRHG